MEPSKVSKIIEKITALRKIADSTHSKHEKETAIAMAAKLIAEYQVSEADIEAQSGQAVEADELVNGTVIYETGRSVPWKSELVWGLARLNNLYARNGIKKMGTVAPSKAVSGSTYFSGYEKGKTLTVNPGLEGSSSGPPKRLT